jgi:hypothetical protein
METPEKSLQNLHESAGDGTPMLPWLLVLLTPRGSKELDTNLGVTVQRYSLGRAERFLSPGAEGIPNLGRHNYAILRSGCSSNPPEQGRKPAQTTLAGGIEVSA